MQSQRRYDGVMDSSQDGASMAPALERLGAFADRDDWRADGWCGLQRALEVIGTRSAMMLLREVYYGGTRFEDLVRRAGVSEAVAAGRLKQLHAEGLLDRRPYREPGKRTRYEYVLTELGRRLYPALVALIEWGELLEPDRGTGIELVHRDCGSPLEATVRCERGHDVALEEAGVRIRNEARAKAIRRRRVRADRRR